MELYQVGLPTFFIFLSLKPPALTCHSSHNILLDTTNMKPFLFLWEGKRWLIMVYPSKIWVQLLPFLQLSNNLSSSVEHGISITHLVLMPMKTEKVYIQVKFIRSIIHILSCFLCCKFLEIMPLLYLLLSISHWILPYFLFFSWNTFLFLPNCV